MNFNKLQFLAGAFLMIGSVWLGAFLYDTLAMTSYGFAGFMTSVFIGFFGILTIVTSVKS